MCGAIMWKEETNDRGKFSMCCSKGKVKVPLPKVPEPEMRDLFDSRPPPRGRGHAPIALELDADLPQPPPPTNWPGIPSLPELGAPDVRHFFNNMRLYNQNFCMASSAADWKHFPPGIASVGDQSEECPIGLRDLTAYRQ